MLQPHRLQHVRLPCPLPSPRTCSNSCLLSWWYHPTISSSVIPFSSCSQSFPASGSFPMSQFFTSGGRSIRASASVLPMNIQDWFPLGWTGLISLQSKGLSRVPDTFFLIHNSALSLVNVAIPIFFWLVLACVLLCSFTFKLSLPLYLNEFLLDNICFSKNWLWWSLSLVYLGHLHLNLLV